MDPAAPAHLGQYIKPADAQVVYMHADPARAAAIAGRHRDKMAARESSTEARTLEAKAKLAAEERKREVLSKSAPLLAHLEVVANGGTVDSGSTRSQLALIGQLALLAGDLVTVRNVVEAIGKSAASEPGQEMPADREALEQLVREAAESIGLTISR